jgi:WD40 repeat protein
MNKIWNLILGRPHKRSLSVRLAIPAIGLLLLPSTLSAAESDSPSRVDLYGDPLPKGALLRLGTIRLRHRSFITHAVFSPDGRSIASTGPNQERGVYLWDVATGRLVRHFFDPDDERGSWGAIAFSPDGKILLAGRFDGSVALWKADSGNLLWKAKEHVRDVMAAAFAPDGKQFATGGADGKVCLWNIAGGKPLLSFHTGEKQPRPMGDWMGGYGGVAALAFSPDGNLLAAGNRHNAAIRIWDLTARSVKAETPPGHGDGELHFIAFARDGKQILSSGYWMKPREEAGIAFPAKNVQVPEIRLWDAATGKLVREFNTPEPEAGQAEASLSADGKILATGGYGAVRIWNAVSGAPIGRIDMPGSFPHAVALSPDGRTLAAPRNHSLVFWDVAGGKPIPPNFQAHETEIVHLACTPDAMRIFSGGSDGVVRCWDSKTGRPLYERSLGNNPSIAAMALSRDGTLLAAGGWTDWSNNKGSVVRLWKANGGEHVRDLDTGRRDVRRLVFSPDGRLLALATDSGRNAPDIDIWNIAAGKVLSKLQIQKRDIILSTMTFSPDAKTFCAVRPGVPAVQTWDVDSGKPQKRYYASLAADESGESSPKQKLNLWGAIVLPDSMRLVAAADNSLRIWDLVTGKCLSSVRLPGERYGRHIAVSPDGRMVAAAEILYCGHEGTGRISLCSIDPETGELALVESRNDWAARMQASEDGRAISMALTPDNKRLIVGTDRGTVVVWVTPRISE